MRCVPVKKGWHTEQTSVFNSGSVDPVVNVLPHRQWTTASVWYSGWIPVFMGALERSAGTSTSVPHGQHLLTRCTRCGGARGPGEVAMLDTGQPFAHGLVGLAHADAAVQGFAGARQDLDQPVVIDVERPPLDLLHPHRAACRHGRIQLAG